MFSVPMVAEALQPHEVEKISTRSRTFESTEPLTLAVGGNRGVASLLWKNRRFYLLDMKGDQEPEAVEEGENIEEMEQ